MDVRLIIVAACALPLLSTACGSNGRPTGWTMPSTESFLMESSVAGRTFEIGVALPRGYEQSQLRHPVLYVLDANGMFPIAVETARFLEFDGPREQPVIVGIGYPVGLYWNTLAPRIRDFTPTPDPEWTHRIGTRFGFAPEGSGGAAEFLALLESELIPVIERRYRVDGERRALFGYSLAGLFATYVLFHAPNLFESYLIGAPGLWWGDGVVWSYEEAFAVRQEKLNARVLLTAGSLDTSHVEIVDRLEDLFRSRNYDGLAWHTQILQNETHNSVIAASLARGIRWLYGDMVPVP